MKTLKVKTPAKINLTLEVLNKREDGFHNIQSIMQTVNLYDFLTFNVSQSNKTEINLSGNSSEIPYDEHNLIYKCAKLFLDTAKIENVRIDIHIEKHIPVSAGLAGGSTNGAGTFFALNKIFDNPLSDKEIENLCAKMGSDLNFCLNGGCMLCTSRGEITERLPFYELDVSLVKPKKLGISAKEAYTKFSLLTDKSNPNNTKKLKELLLLNKFDKGLIYNSFEKALFPDYEQLRYIKNNVKDSLMSGSGSTFFVLKDKLNADFNPNDYDIFEGLKTIQTGVEIVQDDIIITEKTNPNTVNIDISSSFEIAEMINNEDLKVAQKISENLNSIAKAIDVISESFLNNGRLFYFGAGTSGRLGVLDASECPPTFNSNPEMVQGIIAGGDKALRFAIEGAEDNAELAKEDFDKLNINSNDTVVAISASGNAAYVIEILKLAKAKNCKTISLTCNPQAKMSNFADIVICIETGPEAVTGSTRMKAGTAQKMVLNMLTTGAMVKIGKTYKNLMIDVKPTNIKLKDRAARIVSQIAEVEKNEAKNILESNGYKVKEAILQIKYNLPFKEAERILAENNGILRKVFEKLK